MTDESADRKENNGLDRASEQAGQVAGTVKEQAGTLASDAVEQGRVVVERARDQLREQGRTRTDEAARGLRQLSEQFQALAEGRTEEAGPAADYARQVASRTGDMAGRLESEGLDGLLRDMTAFARRRPVVFLVAAGTAGFVVGRAVRSGALSGSSNGRPQLGSANGPHGAPGMVGNGEDAAQPALSYSASLGESSPAGTQPMASPESQPSREQR